MAILELTIVADVGERRSGVAEQIASLGIDVTERRLAVGDYLVAPACIVERKTVADLHRSLQNGRLWTQIEGIRRSALRGWLLVEGAGVDRGPLSRVGIRGALLSVIDTGLPIIWTANQTDSAMWLAALAGREARRRGHGSRWKMRRGRQSPAVEPCQLLDTIPGASAATAKKLLTEFGSIEEISRTTTEELMRIDGIGPVRAATIERLLRNQRPV